MKKKTRHLYKIADLIIDIPAAGDLVDRCKEYEIDTESNIDIIISEKKFDLDRWPRLTRDEAIYVESGTLFNYNIVRYNGMMLHSSAVAVDGKAYLFSGPCGVGKSTHTSLWKNIFENEAQIINDDKPILRKVKGKWFVYGTPWSGKNGINKNIKVPLCGVCFLKKGTDNSIRRLDYQEALPSVLSQTIHKFQKSENLDKMLVAVDQLVREIPIYELTNRPEPEAAILSYETMCKGAEEAGL